MKTSQWCIFRLKTTTTITLASFFAIAVFLSLPCCDARRTTLSSQEDVSVSKTRNTKHLKILEVAKNLNMLMDVSMKDSSSSSNPLYNSLAPIPLPNNNNDSPPYCIYPPPNSPSIIPGPTESSPIPIITGPITPSPPNNPSIIPGPTESIPSPIITGPITPSPPNSITYPPIIIPAPPASTSNPLSPFTPYYEPSPPSPIGYEPSPIISPPSSIIPSPIGFVPSPPVFEPPVVYPPPAVPPPGSSGGISGPGVWCVAKPSVPDPIIQEAMNYACGSGADCDPLQPNGQCYRPNTLLAHASYAFNSYWQRTKVAGGTCSFGGTAILVTVDPSSQGCRFSND